MEMVGTVAATFVFLVFTVTQMDTSIQGSVSSCDLDFIYETEAQENMC